MLHILMQSHKTGSEHITKRATICYPFSMYCTSLFTTFKSKYFKSIFKLIPLLLIHKTVKQTTNQNILMTKLQAT